MIGLQSKQTKGPERSDWVKQLESEWGFVTRRYFSWKIGRNPADADVDDLESEMAVIIWRKSAALSRLSNLEKLRWMRTTAKFLVFQYYARRKRLRTEPTRLVAKLGADSFDRILRDPHQVLSDQEALKRVLELVATLPLKHQQCFHLRRSGQSFSKIATALSVNPSTARRWFVSSRRFLRQQLANDDD